MRLRRKQVAPETVIDLRGPVASRPTWGSPVACPGCSGPGYLDHIDPFKDIMYLHCTTCGLGYQFTKDDFARIVA